MKEIVVFHLCFFSFSVLFSFVINKLFLKAYHNFGQKANGEQIRWDERPKPLLGGFSFYILFLFSISLYAIIFDNDFFDIKIMGILFAVSFGFMLGWADDGYGTNPFLKFLGQFICANILAGTGLIIQITEVEVFDYMFTIFWVIGIMNSINMLDNMDGITCVVSISIILALLGICLIGNDFHVIYLVMLIGVVGALFGFLYFNIHPSKMYMGDTGSQFLGVFLSAVAIPILWPHRDADGYIVQLKQFIIPSLVFLVPIIDTTTVFIRRISRKQSPFVGGKDHTTHHLAFLGINDRYVMLIFWGTSLFTSIFAVISYWYMKSWHLGFSIMVFGFCLLIFIIFQIAYNRGKRINNLCQKYDIIKLRTIRIKKKKA